MEVAKTRDRDVMSPDEEDESLRINGERHPNGHPLSVTKRGMIVTTRTEKFEAETTDASNPMEIELECQRSDGDDHAVIDDDGGATEDQGSADYVSSLKDARNVQLVDIELENLSYSPITSTATAKALPRRMGRSEPHRTRVLKRVSTSVSPYKLTAWMGPSGSGKTSLTSVVASLVDPSDISSDSIIRVNGDEGQIPKRLVGVVWQDDLLLSNLTVEETIYFAARLKTPKQVPDENVHTLVEETMKELGLLHIRDNLIGSSVANLPGISGGERKRAAVAAELVVRPSLLLLDEPTSGLDATTAQQLMSTLKDLVDVGHSIAVVIHQPRTDIFKMLDHLLLLSKGQVIFNGNPADARSYLESIPGVEKLPPETGIADWLMDTIIADEKRVAQKGKRSLLAEHWASAQQKTLTSQATVDAMLEKSYRREMSTLGELHNVPQKYESPFLVQLKLLLRRTLKQRRGEKLTRVACLLQFSYIAFTSIFWWRLPDNTAWIFERNSLIFFLMIAQGNSIVIGSVTVFQQERALLRRERAKKMYGVLPYFLSKTTSDMTNNVLLPLLYGIIVYFTAALELSVVRFFRFILAYYLTLTSAQSMGFLLSIMIKNISIALILAPPITLFFFIIGGFYIPLNNMHAGIKWASYASFARYGFSSLVVNEFENRHVPCADDVPIAVGGTDECPLPGEVVLESIGIEGIFTNYWFNIMLMSILQVFFLIAAYGLLRRSK